MILETSSIMAFIATTQPERARAFYCDTLGMHLEEETPFALVLRTANATLRIQKVQAFTPQPFTVLGWEVSDAALAAKQLVEHGIELLHYKGMGQDAMGIWISPAGARICWFKDPDGNVLSLTQSA